ncbi:MAG: hypothetical protein ACTSX6_04020 [Candidatus Heimdallarchaeaceae archaeon]
MEEAVVVFQTITGEIGVGKYKEGDFFVTKAAKVVQVEKMVDGKPVMGIVLIPFLAPFSNIFPDLPTEKLIVCTIAHPDLAKQYIETTSGIKIPSPEEVAKITLN